MGKGTKELLHKLLAYQELIMAHLKINVPATASIKESKKVDVTKTSPPKPAPKKTAAVKKVTRRK